MVLAGDPVTIINRWLRERERCYYSCVPVTGWQRGELVLSFNRTGKFLLPFQTAGFFLTHEKFTGVIFCQTMNLFVYSSLVLNEVVVHKRYKGIGQFLAIVTSGLPIMHACKKRFSPLHS